jgi:branched-chain amino acid transport system ATP-binding protein
MKKNKMFFEIIELHVNYDGAHALKGISFYAEQGEIITIIGANSAGKSTTMSAISGLIKPSLGQIRYNGQEITGLPPQKIVSLGISQVPEARHLFPYMKVVENLLMGSYRRRDRRKIKLDLERVLNLFPALRYRLNQEVGSMSGGEQQMVAVGRALMANPKLLLLDEPSLGLAPLLIKKIGKTILEINEKDRIGIVLVEQNARMALKLSNRGYVMELGEIALEGDSKDLINNDYIIDLYLGG